MLGFARMMIIAFAAAGCAENLGTEQLTAQGDCAPVLAVTPSETPQVIGTVIDWSTVANCPSGTVEYRYLQRDPLGQWTTVRPYGPGADFQWDTTGLADGSYAIQVWVRRVGSGVNWEGHAGEQVDLVAPGCASVALQILTPSPAVVGGVAQFQAAATCAPGASAEYRYLARDPAGTWSEVRGWDADAQYDMPLADDILAGRWMIQVWARDAVGGEPNGVYDSYDTGAIRVEYAGTCGAPCAPTLTFAPSEPMTGNTVTLDAVANCGGDAAEYRYLARGPDVGWTEVGAWSPDASLAWDTTGLSAGRWDLQLWVRRAGCDAANEGVYRDAFFRLGPLGVCSPVVITSVTSDDAPDYGEVGTVVRASASATCTAGVAEYRYWAIPRGGPDWILLRDWGPSGDLVWDTTGFASSRRYTVEVQARESSWAGDNRRYPLDAMDHFSFNLLEVGAGDGCDLADCDYPQVLSKHSDGPDASMRSARPSLSATGSVAAFESLGVNLVSDDTNDVADIFVRDVVAGTTVRVSVGSDGTQANGASWLPRISGDGLFVVFATEATNLHPGGGGVFVHDLTLGTTTRLGIGDLPAISADGRFVTYSSTARLVEPDRNRRADLFLYDQASGMTELISVTPSGSTGDHESARAPASITPDGRFVAFGSLASDLVAGDTNNQYDIFVRDRVAGTTERISVASDGSEANQRSYAPTISSDGRFVAFYSKASNLVAGDVNNRPDIFVHDRTTGVTTLVSVDETGSQFVLESLNPGMSADGRYVTWDLGPHPSSPHSVWVHDRQTGTSQVVSTARPDDIAISADGLYVAFASRTRLLGNERVEGNVYLAPRTYSE